MVEDLIEWGVPENTIYYEAFGPASVRARTAAEPQENSGSTRLRPLPLQGEINFLDAVSHNAFVGKAGGSSPQHSTAPQPGVSYRSIRSSSGKDWLSCAFIQFRKVTRLNSSRSSNSPLSSKDQLGRSVSTLKLSTPSELSHP